MSETQINNTRSTSSKHNMPLNEKITLGIVDTSHQIDEMSHAMADKALSSGPEESGGVRGFIRKIWKYNLFAEYLRQREIISVQRQIMNADNAFAVEGDTDRTNHENAHRAIMERFIRAREEENGIRAFLHKGESIESLGEGEDERKNSFKELVLDYAQDLISEEDFIARKKDLFVSLQQDSTLLKNSRMYADNTLVVAQQVKEALRHDEGLHLLDVQLDVFLGKAVTGTKTKQQLSSAEKILEKLNKSFSLFTHPTVVSAAVAMVYDLGSFATKRFTSSKAAAVGTVGASAVVGGVVAGLREGYLTTKEREQDMREAARGESAKRSDSRRLVLEACRYEMREAQELMNSLRMALYDRHPLSGDTILKDLGEKDIERVLEIIADADARVEISDEKEVDLIRYSSKELLEQERLDLDKVRNEAKKQINTLARVKHLWSKEGDFEAILASKKEEQKHAILESMEKRDRFFQKEKRKRVARAVVSATTVGAVIGMSLTELYQYLGESSLGQWYRGDTSEAHGSDHHGVVSEETQSLQEVLQPSENTTRQEEIVLPESNPQPQVSYESVSAQAFMWQHPEAWTVHRVSWLNGDTLRPSQMPKVGIFLGGIHGSGINQNGEYEFSIDAMKKGLFRGVDSRAISEIHSGNLKMLFTLSEDSQDRAFEFPVGHDGKVVIAANHPLGELLLTSENGSLKLLAQHAELVQVLERDDHNPSLTVRVLATVVGEGVENVQREIATPVTLDQPYISPQTLEHQEAIATKSHTDEKTAISPNFPEEIAAPALPLTPRQPLEVTQTTQERDTGEKSVIEYIERSIQEAQDVESLAKIILTLEALDDPTSGDISKESVVRQMLFISDTLEQSKTLFTPDGKKQNTPEYTWLMKIYEGSFHPLTDRFGIRNKFLELFRSKVDTFVSQPETKQQENKWISDTQKTALLTEQVAKAANDKVLCAILKSMESTTLESGAKLLEKGSSQNVSRFFQIATAKKDEVSRGDIAFVEVMSTQKSRSAQIHLEALQALPQDFGIRDKCISLLESMVRTWKEAYITSVRLDANKASENPDIISGRSDNEAVTAHAAIPFHGDIAMFTQKVERYLQTKKPKFNELIELYTIAGEESPQSTDAMKEALQLFADRYDSVKFIRFHDPRFAERTPQEIERMLQWSMYAYWRKKASLPESFSVVSPSGKAVEVRRATDKSQG